MQEVNELLKTVNEMLHCHSENKIKVYSVRLSGWAARAWFDILNNSENYKAILNPQNNTLFGLKVKITGEYETDLSGEIELF